MNARGSLLALIKYHVVACISTVRWRFVPPVYLLALMSFIVDKRRNVWWNLMPLGDDANVWDVAQWFLNNVFYDGFLILLGFALLVEDDIVRGHKDGTLRSTLLLSRSTLRWWCAKILSMGVLALAYMSIVFVAILVASLVMGIPMGFHDSGASIRLADIPIQHRWYTLPAGWSTVAYTAFAVVSLTFTMWVIAVVHQALSLFVFPSRRIPFFVFFAWLLAGFMIQPAGGAWWDVRWLLYPGKCFAEYGRGSISIPVFFGVMTTALVGAAAAGYRRLRRMDF